jgi:hypothetical protein
MLPADTQILRKRYRGPGGRTLTVALVISGAERRGIHRPQVCLVGQGFRILNERLQRVELPGGADLGVMRLDLLAPGADRRAAAPSDMALYWFQSGNRQTPYHLVRLAWTALDGAVHNRRSRWAYVTINGSATTNPTEATRLAAALHEWLRPAPAKLRKEAEASPL